MTYYFLNPRVDQIVGKGSKVDGEAAEDQSMMGRLVKVEKQVGMFHQNHPLVQKLYTECLVKVFILYKLFHILSHNDYRGYFSWNFKSG